MGTQLNKSKSNETGEAEPNIKHTRQEIIKAKQQVTLAHRLRLRHVNLTLERILRRYDGLGRPRMKHREKHGNMTGNWR